MPAAPDALIDRVRAAAADRRPLAIRAGGSKAFYGNAVDAADVLDPRGHAGIVAYAPSELVVTVRAGTPLAALEAALDEHGQMLAFEPPHFGSGIDGDPDPAADRATVGGAIAAGLAGPRRCAFGPGGGSVGHFVLGAQLLDGRGQVLRFGGTVMKNVAGYDVARLLAGSLGTLGVLLEVSLKVLPKPAAEATLRFALPQDKALARMNEWAAQPLPISATAWHADLLYLRLSGARAAVAAACARLGATDGGQPLDAEGAQPLWRGLRDQRHRFFGNDDPVAWPLWRLALPPASPPLTLPGTQLIEWSGAQRWLRSDAAGDEVRAQAQARGGHATLFRGGSAALRAGGVFTPPAAALAAIQRRLKAEFDPAGLFNRGRLYPDF